MNVNILSFFIAIPDPISLSLVGGYKDEAGKAHRLTMKILDFFHAQTSDDASREFHLVTCCLGQPNSQQGRI